jgi:hypothetical protein
VFVAFPWPSVVVVLPTPPWFLPGLSVVVHVTVPWSFVQLSGSGAAETDASQNAATAQTAIAISSAIFLFMNPPGFREVRLPAKTRERLDRR